MKFAADFLLLCVGV